MGEDEFADHVIPVKGEHHAAIIEEYQNPEHFIPEKAEHGEPVVMVPVEDIRRMPKE